MSFIYSSFFDDDLLTSQKGIKLDSLDLSVVLLAFPRRHLLNSFKRRIHTNTHTIQYIITTLLRWVKSNIEHGRSHNLMNGVLLLALFASHRVCLIATFVALLLLVFTSADRCDWNHSGFHSDQFHFGAWWCMMSHLFLFCWYSQSFPKIDDWTITDHRSRLNNNVDTSRSCRLTRSIIIYSMPHVLIFNRGMISTYTPTTTMKLTKRNPTGSEHQHQI